MTAFACLVRQTSAAWLISIGDAEPMVLSSDCKPAELAHAVDDYIERNRSKYGSCHPMVVLCPESQTVLFASSPIPASLKTRDRQQLKYHAESLLPIDAEKMAADFVLTAKELRVLAIDVGEWQPIIDAFSARNLHFRWIAPASVLAIEEAKRTLRDLSPVVIWEENGALDLWRLDASGISRWTHIAANPSDRLLAIRLFAAQTSDVSTWTALHCSESTIAMLNSLGSIAVKPIETESLTVYASRAANRLCRSSFEAWFDLRDGVIAGSDRYRALHGWMKLAVVAVVGFFLVFSAACLWRSFRAERQLASIQGSHEKLFEASFPGVAVPALISMRIKSEHQKIQGSTNGKGEIKPTPSALELLHATLSALAGESRRFRISKLELKEGELMADIFFDNSQDASAIAERFKEAGIDTGPLDFTRDNNGTIRATFKGRLR